MERRDSQDVRRAVAPLRQADDALVVDCTALGVDEIVARLRAFVLSRGTRRGAAMNARALLLTAATWLAASVAPGTLGCGGGGPPPAARVEDAGRARAGRTSSSRRRTCCSCCTRRSSSRDSVYGPVVKSALRVALPSAAPTSLRTACSKRCRAAEMVVVGKSGDSDGGRRGRRPARRARRSRSRVGIAGDTGGTACGTRCRQHSAVPEFANGNDVSLFDLGARTWVVAAGARRQEAREVFAHPFGRPLPFEEDGALALLRIRGETLLDIAPRLRNGDLGPVGKHLAAASLELRPGGEGALVTDFVYRDDESSAFAESTLRDVARALAAPQDGKPPWIAAAEVTQQSRTVEVKAKIAERSARHAEKGRRALKGRGALNRPGARAVSAACTVSCSMRPKGSSWPGCKPERAAAS